jgi:hypothetical protein
MTKIDYPLDKEFMTSLPNTLHRRKPDAVLCKAKTVLSQPPNPPNEPTDHPHEHQPTQHASLARSHQPAWPTDYRHR